MTGFGTAPTLRVSDAGCTGATFRVKTSGDAPSVSRGQYGTTAASHAAAAPVYASYWLDSLNEPNPGLSHSFRVASFGPGGVSSWRYFEVKLVQVIQKKNVQGPMAAPGGGGVPYGSSLAR